MADADDEIREIKKEIVESRGLSIKTNNLVNSLAADIKAIAKRQAGYERRFVWNGAVAYVLFATISFVGLLLASDARHSEIRSERDEALDDAKELREELSEETARTEQRVRAETEAYRFYELIRQQKRADVVQGYERIRGEPLSRSEAAFFRDTVERFRLDLSVSAYQQGLDRMRTGRYAEAEEQFREAIEHQEDGAHIPAVKYNLALTLRHLNRQPEAAVHAQAVIDQNIDRELQDDATWLLSQCAEEMGNLDDARNALRTLLRRWPRSSLATDARRHLGELNLQALRGGNPPR
jgi:TolA-binding protein